MRAHSYYAAATACVAPFIPLWLFYRRWRGKEDSSRLPERFGVASALRPKGNLLWIHAASIGEANSVLPFIDKIKRSEHAPHILLTTGTKSSATLMAKQLPQGVIHQYAPLDTQEATRRFLHHWRPQFAFWVESDLWPNLVMAARRRGVFMGILNGRMSERSFRKWNKFPALMHEMLTCFDVIFAQSESDAKRFSALGAARVWQEGNLKFDAAVLGCDEAELLRLKKMIGARPVWLAASTHPGEEDMIAEAHHALRKSHPELLTVIVPRHPARSGEIKVILERSGLCAVRSEKTPLAPHTQFYLADTLGELGLFYRLAPIVFMGGSLVAHGGQNPLEPARLSCALIAGAHTHNFVDMYREMYALGLCVPVRNAATLTEEVNTLLGDPDKLYAMQNTAKNWVDGKRGACDRIFSLLSPLWSDA